MMAETFFLGGFVGMFTIMFLFFALAVALFVFWVWTIVDCVQRKFDNNNERLVWILLIVLLGLIPSVLYYFLVMRENNRGALKETKKRKR